jgi:hypothetical protein
MSDEKTLIKIMKSIVDADLTKNEIKLVLHFLTKYDKYFIVENSKLSSETDIKIPNLIRTIKDLKSKNVIRDRVFGKDKTNKLYVTTFKNWKKEQTKSTT